MILTKIQFYILFRNLFLVDSTFTILFFKSKIINYSHHNIFLEVAYNYGVFASLLFTIFVLKLFYESYKIIKINNYIGDDNINKFWLTSSFCSIIFHLNDMPYYDGKINLLFWILLSGLKSIINENRKINTKKVSAC